MGISFKALLRFAKLRLPLRRVKRRSAQVGWAGFRHLFPHVLVVERSDAGGYAAGTDACALRPTRAIRGLGRD